MIPQHSPHPPEPELSRRGAKRVTIFLDVDGVLNSFPVERWRYFREGRRKTHAWDFVLHFRPKIVKSLERIVRERDAEIVWLSTWSHRCTEELEPKLGFTRSFAVEPMPDDSHNTFAADPQRWWKAATVKNWFSQNPQGWVIWIDDDLAAPATHDYFAQHYPERLLMIAPEFKRRLTESHLKNIREFTAPRAGAPE